MCSRTRRRSPDHGGCCQGRRRSASVSSSPLRNPASAESKLRILLTVSFAEKVAAARAERITTWTSSETVQACMRYRIRTLRRRLGRSLVPAEAERSRSAFQTLRFRIRCCGELGSELRGRFTCGFRRDRLSLSSFGVSARASCSTVSVAEPDHLTGSATIVGLSILHQSELRHLLRQHTPACQPGMSRPRRAVSGTCWPVQAGRNIHPMMREEGGVPCRGFPIYELS